jgi:hypothetical protein
MEVSSISGSTPYDHKKWTRDELWAAFKTAWNRHGTSPTATAAEREELLILADAIFAVEQHYANPHAAQTRVAGSAG